ncbi:uncharacterized protein METZ01_LOCUS246374 [marine metagenome]|uniref:VOC domain-containing protein n=1 Tax=marine metagenome TaxID=408172 RepID=A0A382I1L6_9ZZZZ
MNLKKLLVLVLVMHSDAGIAQNLDTPSIKETSGYTLANLSIDSQITMFYYTDITPAVHFYGDILGLEKTLDWSWVVFFQTGSSSFIGLVTEGHDAFHDVQPSNAVMLSLVTNDLDLWYERLRQWNEVTFLKSISDSGPIRSFMVEDPGGYTVEFFQWLTPTE